MALRRYFPSPFPLSPPPSWPGPIPAVASEGGRGTRPVPLALPKERSGRSARQLHNVCWNGVSMRPPSLEYRGLTWAPSGWGRPLPTTAHLWAGGTARAPLGSSRRDTTRTSGGWTQADPRGRGLFWTQLLVFNGLTLSPALRPGLPALGEEFRNAIPVIFAFCANCYLIGRRGQSLHPYQVVHLLDTSHFCIRL